MADPPAQDAPDPFEPTAPQKQRVMGGRATLPRVVDHRRPFDFSDAGHYIEAGYRAARDFLSAAVPIEAAAR